VLLADPQIAPAGYPLSRCISQWRSSAAAWRACPGECDTLRLTTTTGSECTVTH
jgi:hypothetical protein